MIAPLKYHGSTLNLLRINPQLSEAALRAVRKREAELGFDFPDSVREWYSLDEAVSLLAAYSNNDWPIEVNRLGAPIEDWYGGGPKNFVANGLLLFMQENQGVCNWAVKLNGTPNPPVVVEVDTAPSAVWLPCAESFSTFIWCQVWDHLPSRELEVAAQETELAQKDLAFLRSVFRELPSTNRWPGNANYRFENENGGILIWEGWAGADWFAHAESAADLKSLLGSIWHCGCLSHSLYPTKGNASTVLDQLRRGT